LEVKAQDMASVSAIAAIKATVQKYTRELPESAADIVRKASEAKATAATKAKDAVRSAKQKLKSLKRAFMAAADSSSPFYALSKSGTGSVLSGWSVQAAKGEDLFDTESMGTRTSVEGTGTLTSPSFIATKNTMAFTVAGGDKDTVITLSVITGTDQFTGTATKEEVRRFVGTGRASHEVFWDISDHSQEMMEFKLSDQSKTAGIYLNNVHLFDDKTIGCLPDCLRIKKISFTDSYYIMGDKYTATDKNVNSLKRAQFCRDDTGSTKLTFKPPLAPKISSGVALPTCVFIEAHPTGLVVSLGENPSHKFLFSAKFAKKSALASDPDVKCMYPTLRPRCLKYVGVAKQRAEIIAKCEPDVTVGTPPCRETIIESRCDGKSVCGEDKQIRDMLMCCDRNDLGPGSNYGGCIGRRRRLGASHSSMAFAGYRVSGSKTKSCADRCMGQAGCLAWHVDSLGHCRMTSKCTLKGNQHEEQKWIPLPGVSVEKLFHHEKAKLVNGKLLVQREKWEASK